MAHLQTETETLPAPQPPMGEPPARRRRRRRSRTEDGGEARKRRLSEDQAKFLEARFWEEKKLENRRKTQLAAELGLEPKQVAVWFQNRRARLKCKQVEEEYVKLKAAHDAAVVHNHRLEAEMLKLQEQLLEAQERIRSLSVGSPSTPASFEMQQTAAEELVAAQHADPVYIDDCSYFNYMWDLISIHGF